MVAARTDGRSLPPGTQIRPAQREDEATLQGYFQALPWEDRLLRFFSPSPPRTYAVAWLALEEEGGGTLLVMRSQSDGSLRCVGEAGYVPRGDGTAEFALSLAPEARGGVGSILLDRLREHALGRDIEALYADVLSDNGAMNRLLAKHGRVTVERDGNRAAGVVIPTSSGVAPWPERDPRPTRVLVESAGGRWEAEDDLRAEGYQVAVCPGPNERPPSDPCPVLVRQRCSLVDGADVIIHALSPEHPPNTRLGARLAATVEQRALVRRPPGGTSEVVAEVQQRLSGGENPPGGS